MAEEEQTTTPNGAADPAAMPQIKQRILAQFVRDLSFENEMSKNGVDGEVKPEIKVEVNLDARKRGTENQYEVITKLKVTSTNTGSAKTLFLLELEYSGVFEIEGVPEQQMHPYLMIECPRMTFPFIRRIAAGRAEQDSRRLSFLPEGRIAQCFNKSGVGISLRRFYFGRKRCGTRGWAPIASGCHGLRAGLPAHDQIRLATPDQFKINFGENFTIKQSAVQRPI